MNHACTAVHAKIQHLINIVARAPKGFRVYAVKLLNIHVQHNHAKMVARVPLRYVYDLLAGVRRHLRCRTKKAKYYGEHLKVFISKMGSHHYVNQLKCRMPIIAFIFWSHENRPNMIPFKAIEFNPQTKSLNPFKCFAFLLIDGNRLQCNFCEPNVFVKKKLILICMYF